MLSFFILSIIYNCHYLILNIIYTERRLDMNYDNIYKDALNRIERDSKCNPFGCNLVGYYKITFVV